ncbi:hypothetical protein [Candidatus Protofrankia californiensis]|uniref:hypothetical protein n=1 Tax=Candidatus Protofrankia californiensis TaxID=1839754 RepID=UPI0019D25A44|nr:hypothetical protein [Candidatus Protofrankia californiensis]
MNSLSLSVVRQPSGVAVLDVRGQSRLAVNQTVVFRDPQDLGEQAQLHSPITDGRDHRSSRQRSSRDRRTKASDSPERL